MSRELKSKNVREEKGQAKFFHQQKTRTSTIIAAILVRGQLRTSNKIEDTLSENQQKNRPTLAELISHDRREQFKLQGCCLEMFYGRKNRSERGSNP